jgi:hypothetical protein
MVTCRLVIRYWILINYSNPAKITNNSSGVPTTPTPMPKSVQISFLKNISILRTQRMRDLIPGAAVVFIGWTCSLTRFAIVPEFLTPSWIRSWSPSLVEL